MARMRTMKPEYFRSRSLAKCPPLARLTFAGLWTEADDHGRGIADARLLKGALWALDDDVTHLHVSAHLRVLAETGHIRLYRVGDETYYEVVNWEKHQAAAYRRGEPKYPPFSAGQRIDDDSASSCVQESASRTETSAGTGNREQGTGKEPPASPSEDAAAEVVDAELIDDDTTADSGTTSKEVAVPKPVTAQTIVGALVDACTARRINLPQQIIGQYAKRIKTHLDEGHPPERIWAALRLMADDNVLNRPSLLTNKLVTVQTGPERAPQRQSRSTTDDRVNEWLTLFDDEEATRALP